MASLPFDPAADLADLNGVLPLRKISDKIDRLLVSADLKALLLDLARVTVRVGAGVLKIGAKILTLVFDIIGQFPNTTFGVVIGVCLGLLVGGVPFIGAVLGPFLMPVLVAFGLARGALADLASAGWAARLRDLEARLASVGA